MAEIGSDIAKARHLLNLGELVAIPTETVYGLAANALNAQAVAKIFEVKKRPRFDPLIVHIKDPGSVSEIVEFIPPVAAVLMQHFWPGPLTLVMKRKTNIPDLVTSGLSTVAVRMPDHALTRRLLQHLDYPLACPSANPFGYVSPTCAAHVQQQLGDRISYILDGGPCKIGIESTIVGFESTRPVIYRLGGITVERIQQVIGEVAILDQVSDPVSPGMLKSHYAPDKKVILGDISLQLAKYSKESLGILSFQKHFPEIPHDRQIQLSPQGSLSEAAQNLFAALRILDAMPISHILAEPVPDHGLGKAINDRLRRAAG